MRYTTVYHNIIHSTTIYHNIPQHTTICSKRPHYTTIYHDIPVILPASSWTTLSQNIFLVIISKTSLNILGWRPLAECGAAPCVAGRFTGHGIQLIRNKSCLRLCRLTDKILNKCRADRASDYLMALTAAA